MSEEIEQAIPEEVQEPQEVQEDLQTKDQSSTTQNWELARQALAQQKAEIEQLKSMLNQKPPEPEVDPFDGLDPEDYLTVEEARKRFEPTIAKKAKEAASELLQQYSFQQKIQADEQRLRSKNEDYDFVVENFSIPLLKNNPALAMQVQNSKNPAETAYLLGKLSDGYMEMSNKQQPSNKAEKILKNSQRPISAASVSTPLKSQADYFSKRSKADIWQESQKYARGA